MEKIPVDVERLLSMFEVCAASPAYMHLESPEAEGPDQAHTLAAKQEGFVNGWAWAQATARECLALRKLPAPVELHSSARRCGSCRWFVQHYRYTGAYPWFSPVGCGHCTGPRQDKRKRMVREPDLDGCGHWEPGG